MSDDEIEREILVGYRLVIHSAGLGFEDKTELTDEYPANLVPQVRIDEVGVRWEVYKGDGENDWVELRQEYIWSRSLSPVMERNPLLDMIDDSDDHEVSGPFRPPEAPQIRARAESDER